MSLFRRAGSPYWYSEIQVRGARVVRSTGTSDKREAARFERALRESLKRETAAKPRLAMTLSQAAARFWNEHGKDLRSARSTHWNVNRFMQFFGEDLLLCELSNKHVAELVEARKADGAAAAGINRTLAALRQVHRMASRRWDEPVKSIDWSQHWRQEPKERVRWLTPAEATRLLDELPEHIRLAAEWSLYTGCRKSETFGLRWSDVDLERGFATVQGKTGARTVWLSAEARGVLDRSPRQSTAVFDGTNHRKLFEAAAKACAISDFRWHDLRHTHATWLRQAGAPLEVVQRSLGHTLITTTQRYAHVDDAEIREALRKLPDLSTASGNVVRLKGRKGE